MTFQLFSLPLSCDSAKSLVALWPTLEGTYKEKGFWEHQSMNRRNMALKGTSGLTWMKVPWTNKFHLFKGQVISNMLFDSRQGNHLPKSWFPRWVLDFQLCSKDYSFSRGDLENLLILARAFISKMKILHANSLLWPKSKLSEKKSIWKKMSVSSTKNWWNSS